MQVTAYFLYAEPVGLLQMYYLQQDKTQNTKTLVLHRRSRPEGWGGGSRLPPDLSKILILLLASLL